MALASPEASAIELCILLSMLMLGTAKYSCHISISFGATSVIYRSVSLNETDLCNISSWVYVVVAIN